MIIKYSPEDFFVREVLSLEDKPEGNDYAYFIMRKKNLSTIRAIKIVSRRLRISRKRISFAGEKDKKAVTEQVISIYKWNGKKDYDFGNVQLKYIGHYAEPIYLGDLIGNEFRIVLRNVDKEELGLFMYNLDFIRSHGVINYFDDQRFGDIRANNHLIGREMLKRNWEEAVKILLTLTSDRENPKASMARERLRLDWGNFKEALKYFPGWLDVELAVLNSLASGKDYKAALKSLHRRLLKMFIHSYQSLIFNETLSEFIRRKFQSLFTIETSVGTLFVPREDYSWLCELTVPIVGYNTNLSGELGEIIREILSRDEISVDDFFFEEQGVSFLSSEGSERKACVRPENLHYDVSEDEVFKDRKKIVLEFFLPKGSYATMLVKQLFAKDRAFF